MRSAGVFILAFVASVVIGMLAFAASSLLPDWDDAAGRGLGEAFRALLIAVYVIFAIVIYGFAAWRGDRERHLKRGLRILCLVPLLIPVLGLIDNGIHNIHWFRETVGAVQMFRAAVDGCLGTMADPAYVSASTGRACRVRLHMNIQIALNRRASGTTTA
jgi:hypothetical protein